MQTELSLHFRALFVDKCPRSRPEPADADPTLATPGATILDKTQGFAPESAFPREITCFWELLLPTYLILLNDEVDMMV